MPVAAAWLALGLLAASPSSALGHAELASSTPEANAVLDRSPDAVVLRFRQPIDPATAVLRVVDEHGATLTAPGALQATGDGLELRIGLPPLGPGQYTTEYRVTSALDGHSTAGRLVFLVDPTGTLPLSAPRADLPQSQTDAPPAAARWLAVAPMLVVGGTVVFWLTAVLPFGPTSTRAEDSRRKLAPPWWAVAACGLAAFLGTALYLALLASSMGTPAAESSGLPFDFAAPFGATPFAWAMRVALAGSLAIFVLAGTSAILLDEGRRRGRWDARATATDRRIGLAVAGLAAVVLGGFGASGHTASAGGAVGATLDWLHLVAAAVLLGTAPGVLVLAARKGRPVGALRGAVRRYLPLALGAAVVVGLTGLGNAPLVSGPARELVASGYGNLLLAKVVLLSAATALLVTTSFAMRLRGDARRWLIGGQVATLLVGMAAVAASSTLAATEPAAHRRGVVGGPPSSALHLYGEADGIRVHAVVNAPAPGVQQYQAVVTRTDGTPLEDAERVVMRFDPPDGSSLAASDVELGRQPVAGSWGIRGAHTPEPGEWGLDVLVTVSGEREITVPFSVAVTEPLPTELVPEPASGIMTPAPLALAWELLPRGPGMWIPVAVALAVLMALLVVARRSRAHGAAASGWRAARVAVSIVAVVLGIAAGSRALVDAAAAPPPEAAARPNPVEATTDSIERGARLYVANCAACHGVEGNAGALADGLLPGPESMDHVVRESTPGGLAYVIAAGKPGTPMPGFVATLSTRDRWDLVNYLLDRFGVSP